MQTIKNNFWVKAFLVIAPFSLLVAYLLPLGTASSQEIISTHTINVMPLNENEAYITGDFPFSEQKVDMKCFEDGYCLAVFEMVDPTPQPN